jgi:hypothetical protein
MNLRARYGVAADSDSGAVQAVIEQQTRMGTLPKEQLAGTAYGSEVSVALCACVVVTLVAPVPGRAAAAKTKKQKDPEGAPPLATWTEVRRAEQESGEWKKRYALRSGIEGVNEALDRTTGMKALRVRGRRAVHMAISLKVTGCNIKCAATILRLRVRRQDRAAKAQKQGLEGSKTPQNGSSGTGKPLSRRSPLRLRLHHRRFSPRHHLRP